MKDAEACEVCGVRKATYVCQGCGARVCEVCYNLERRLCARCLSTPVEALVLSESTFEGLLTLGMILTMLGVFLMAISSLFMIGSTGGKTIIVIGPFPIVIGENVSPDVVILIGIALTILTFGLIVVFFLKRWKGGSRSNDSHESFIPVPEEGIEREASRGLKDYLIALNLPDLEEESLSIRIFGRYLRIEASSRRGERTVKTYRFPRGIVPSAYRYSYDGEGGLLILRVSLAFSRAIPEP